MKIPRRRRVLLPLAGLLSLTGLAAAQDFRRGDANCDGCVTCFDADLVIQHLSASAGAGEELCCLDAADADGDQDLDLDDAVAILAMGPGAPPCAGPPGAILGCAAYPAEFCGGAVLDCAEPSALITGPETVVWPGGPVEVAFDGSDSLGTGKKPASRYHWAASIFAPGSAKVLGPEESLTVIRFDTPGAYTVKLDVSPFVFSADLSSPDDGHCAHVEKVVTVLAPDSPESAPDFAALPPALRHAIAGRPFRAQVVLTAGVPAPAFELVAVGLALPAGLSLDATSGVLTWSPGLRDLGTHVIGVRAMSSQGSFEAVASLRVFDPAHTAASYAPAAAGGGGEEGGGGGGAPVLGAAPDPLNDGSLFLPASNLRLSTGGPPCAVQGVDPNTSQSAVRFSPGCAAPLLGTAGKVYSSSDAAGKLTGSVENDFTVELWLSDVPDSQLASAETPAFIFSASSQDDQSITFNWMVGAAGNRKYVAQVATSAGTHAFNVDGVDFRDEALHQLAFVRRGTTHAFFVDGVPAGSADQPGDLGPWTSAVRVHLGNSERRTRPFTGDVHLAAFYPDALSDEMIAYLSDLGPSVSDPGDVLGPIAAFTLTEICPDPREIGRVDFDATESAALGGNGGGGADVTNCGLLRPFIWTLTAPQGALLTVPAEDECDPLQSATYDRNREFTLEARLDVLQLPIRDEERSATTTRTIALPQLERLELRRGDANADGGMDISDAVWTLGFLFTGGPAPDCHDAADANDSGAMDISDAIFTLGFLFTGGAAPPAPGHLTCGQDPTTTDPLGCGDYLPCL